MSGKAMKQGSLDGFCGIYALAHLVGIRQPTKYDQVAAETFFGTLRSLEKVGRLTAKRIGSTNCNEMGFKASFLAAAFNDMNTKRRWNLKAIAFSKAKFRSSRFFKNASLAFREECAFVIRVDSGNHWVATTAVNADGAYDCYDPLPACERSSFGKIYWDEGLMVGPSWVIEEI
jgi:hypothetical protein